MLNGTFNFDTWNQNTPLHRSIFNDKTEEALALIEAKNINLEEINDSGETYLHHAIDRANPKIVEALLQKGAQIEAIYVTILKENRTPIQSSLELVNYHVKAPNEMFIPWLELPYAYMPDIIIPNNKRVVELLIQAGADLTVIDNKGNSLLHILLNKKPFDADLTKLLFLGNPNIDLPNKNGKTVRDIINERDNKDEIFDIFKKMTEDAFTAATAMDIITKQFSKILKIHQPAPEIVINIMEYARPAYVPYSLINQHFLRPTQMVNAMNSMREQRIKERRKSI